MSMGAKVSVVDKEGKSPMDYAEQLGSEMIAILKGNHLICCNFRTAFDLSFLILSRRTSRSTIGLQNQLS